MSLSHGAVLVSVGLSGHTRSFYGDYRCVFDETARWIMLILPD